MLERIEDIYGASISIDMAGILPSKLAEIGKLVFEGYFWSAFYDVAPKVDDSSIGAILSCIDESVSYAYARDERASAGRPAGPGANVPTVTLRGGAEQVYESWSGHTSLSYEIKEDGMIDAILSYDPLSSLNRPDGDESDFHKSVYRAIKPYMQ
jgi:hypothetical protein